MNTATWARLQRGLAAHRRAAVAALVGLAVLFGLSAVSPAAPPTVPVLVAAHDLVAGATLSLADLRSASLPPAAVPGGALRPGADVLGRLVAGPVRRGEPLTDVRLLGPSLLAALARGPGVVAVPVRFADSGAAALLRAGDHVDVLAAATDAFVPDLAVPPDAAPSPPAAGVPRSGAPPGAGGPAPPGESGPAPPGAAPGGARVVAADVVVLLVAGAGPVGTDPGAAGGYLGGGAASLADGALVVVACSPATARALAAAAANARLSPVLRAPP
jgi:hypothetical protein